MVLGDKASDHKLIGLAKIRSIGFNHHTRIIATLGHLHHSTNLICTAFVKAQRRLARQILDIIPGSVSASATRIAAPVAHAREIHAAHATRSRFRTAIRAHQVKRIRRQNVVCIALARKEHNHVALSGNRGVAKYPATRIRQIVRKRKAFQAHRSIGRVVKFNPPRIVTVIVLEVRIRRRNFREKDRTITIKMRNDRSGTRSRRNRSTRRRCRLHRRRCAGRSRNTRRRTRNDTRRKPRLGCIGNSLLTTNTTIGIRANLSDYRSHWRQSVVIRRISTSG